MGLKSRLSRMKGKEILIVVAVFTLVLLGARSRRKVEDPDLNQKIEAGDPIVESPWLGNYLTIWVVNEHTNTPIEGASVEAISEAGSLLKGTTDQEGLVLFVIPWDIQAPQPLVRWAVMTASGTILDQGSVKFSYPGQETMVKVLV